MKRLIKISFDINDRDAAIVYIDGNILELEGETHAQIINDYLISLGLEGLNYTMLRPKLFGNYNNLTDEAIEDIKNIKENINSIAFAHKVDNENGIFIDTDELYNVRLYTVVDALKNKYKYYDIYDNKDFNTKTLNFEKLSNKKIENYYDIMNRNAAVLYIDGEILEGETHANIITKYLNERGLGGLYNKWHRPGLFDDPNDLTENGKKDVEKVKENINSMAYAHRVDKENGIFIDTSKLYNIDLNTVVNALKNEYKNYDIYDDNNYNPDTLEFKKIANKKIKSHDMGKRTSAIAYIDGKILEGNTHAQIIDQYLKNNKLGELNDIWTRPELFIDDLEKLFEEDKKDVELIKENINSIAFAHKVDKEKRIYLDTELYNIDRDTIIGAFQNKYKDYDIYDDDNHELIIEKIANKRLIKSKISYDINYQDKTYEIYENPTSDELLTIKKSNLNNSIRGVIYEDGTIYVWDGELLHNNVKHIIDINQFRFSVDDISWLIDAHNEYTKNEVIKLINKYKDILSQFGNLYINWEFFRTKDKYHCNIEPNLIFEKNIISSRLKNRNKELWEVSMSPISPLYPGFYIEEEKKEVEVSEDEEID